MYCAYIRSNRCCPLSNILCKSELVKKLAKWKLIDSKSILCTEHNLDLGPWKHFRAVTDNSHWSDIHSFLLTNPCRIFMKYCCLAREEHRKSKAQHQLGWHCSWGDGPCAGPGRGGKTQPRSQPRALECSCEFWGQQLLTAQQPKHVILQCLIAWEDLSYAGGWSGRVSKARRFFLAVLSLAQTQLGKNTSWVAL